jgi:hypothetical protein
MPLLLYEYMLLCGYITLQMFEILMIPINVSISDITYVDFKHKRVLENKVFLFEKMDLLRAGLIDFERLVRKGRPMLVASQAEVSGKEPTEPAGELFEQGS